MLRITCSSTTSRLASARRILMLYPPLHKPRQTNKAAFGSRFCLIMFIFRPGFPRRFHVFTFCKLVFLFSLALIFCGIFHIVARVSSASFLRDRVSSIIPVRLFSVLVACVSCVSFVRFFLFGLALYIPAFLAL